MSVTKFEWSLAKMALIFGSWRRPQPPRTPALASLVDLDEVFHAEDLHAVRVGCITSNGPNGGMPGKEAAPVPNSVRRVPLGKWFPLPSTVWGVPMLGAGLTYLVGLTN